MPKPNANQNNENIEDVKDDEKNEQVEDQNEDTGTNGEEVPQQDPKPSGERTFSQLDVNRMMAREKKQGRNSVYNELGIDPNDAKSIELIKTLMGATKAQNAESGDAGMIDQRVAEAERRAIVAEAKSEAMMLGVKPQFVDDVVTLALAHMEEQGDGAEFKTIIGEMKTKYATWFGGSDDPKETKGQKGTGSSIRSESGSNASKNDDGIGKRLAAQRKPSKRNFSYWGSNK